MAKDKDRAQNPATAALKSQQKKAIAKSKASLAAQRTEKLARRNPDRLQKQLDELVALREAQNGELRPRDREELARLTRDLAAVRKAQASLGIEPRRGRDDAGRRGHSDRGGHSDRRGDGDRRGSRDSDSETTDDDARAIPMPRDTPPPVPRRKRKQQQQEEKPKEEYRATYSAAPQVRDLRREAVAKFVPAAVRRAQLDRKGAAGRDVEGAAEEAVREAEFEMLAREEQGELRERDVDGALRRVEVEEVDDAGD